MKSRNCRSAANSIEAPMDRNSDPVIEDSRQGPKRGVRKLSLRDQAYEAIKKRIVSCELRPGEAVTVADLAEQLQIGRTPVFQAIDRLTVDGLVEVMPRKGVVVAPISMDSLVEIIEMRLLNEAQAANWAAQKATPQEIAQLDANVAATWRAAQDHDLEQMIECDRDFHRLLSGIAGNTILAEFLGNLHDRSLRFWFLSLRAPDHNLRVCEQHAAIVEGIRAHDPEAAEKAMREHISAFHKNLTQQNLRG
ncbi:GntR family transcriptional regulator (plasmid) [Paracoccus versutus]|nr:GntR family transcriptional regulator [Paracoccus versutus]WGR55031.1 GntR family transcriptional regulator [Paracoccus versutus]